MVNERCMDNGCVPVTLVLIEYKFPVSKLVIQLLSALCIVQAGRQEKFEWIHGPQQDYFLSLFKIIM